MTIAFRCPSCGHKLRAPDDAVGKRSRCRCGQSIVIPGATEAKQPSVSDPEWLMESPAVAPALPHKPSGGWTPNASIVAQTVCVHVKPERNAQVVATLVAGDEIRLANGVSSDGIAWVEVGLESGRSGYVLGTTEVYKFRHALLLAPHVTVCKSASENAPRVEQLGKGEVLLLTGVAKPGGSDWVGIRTARGRKGFIPGKTQIDLLPSCPRCGTLHEGKTLGRLAAIFIPCFLAMLVMEIVLLDFLNTKGLQLTPLGIFALLVLPAIVVISPLIALRKCQQCGTRWFDVRYLLGPRGRP
jgi:hypothetical protein